MCVCVVCMSIVYVWCGVCVCLWYGVCVCLWCGMVWGGVRGMSGGKRMSVVCVWHGMCVCGMGCVCVCVCTRTTRSTFSRTVETKNTRFYLGSEKYNKGHFLKHQ